jgi:Holliday junction resolvasome RuvABC endonuclease subunit
VIVGLDTASTRWHAVTLDGDRLDTEWFQDDTGNADQRRIMLYHSARLFFRRLPDGTHVFCEEPLALKNGRTTRQLALAAGAIWAAHMDLDIWWHWVDVSTWKHQIIGNGNASKQMVALWLNRQHIAYPDQDFYDAHCLALYGRKALTALKEVS